jgi:spore maturation protein CgeB
MKEGVFVDGFHFVSVPNKIECEERMKYYFENQKQAAEIASNGFSFFKEFLTPEAIEKYWVSLLISYAKKLK